MPKIMAVCLF